MPEEAVTTEVSATEGQESYATRAETLKGRIAARLRLQSSKRRRIALLIVVAIGIVSVGVVYSHFSQTSQEKQMGAAKEPTAAEQFQIQLDELQKTQEPVARFDAFKINDEMLGKLCEIDQLTTIQVDSESLSIDTVKKLAAMPSLEQLHIRGTEISDAMSEEIAKSKTIWLLNFPNANFTPEGIERLATMPMLRQLRLGVRNGDNRHGRSVAKLTRLRAVHLIGIAVTDEGLRPLSEMPNLESLYLDDSRVTEKGWLWLFQENPQLHVHIDQLHHDRDPNKH